MPGSGIVSAAASATCREHSGRASGTLCPEMVVGSANAAKHDVAVAAYRILAATTSFACTTPFPFTLAFSSEENAVVFIVPHSRQERETMLAFAFAFTLGLHETPDFSCRLLHVSTPLRFAPLVIPEVMLILLCQRQRIDRRISWRLVFDTRSSVGISAIASVGCQSRISMGLWRSPRMCCGYAWVCDCRRVLCCNASAAPWIGSSPWIWCSVCRCCRERQSR